ncbi:M48 family metallopeptidase [Niastella sp. OAS944]|uniref:M48 family metallopeptidase n=1 Tax=Niastella sp. OAS944 TaxID=2664089 RepID=UPI00348573DE|nr:STE24 endopeptidase [Chitinophagaceae bacterium OAS944]
MNYLYFVIAIITLDFLVHQMLGLLNLRNLRFSFPKEVERLYNKEQYRMATKYQIEWTKFLLLRSAVRFLFVWIILLTKGLIVLNDYFIQYTQEPIVLSLLLFWLLLLCNELTMVPFRWYKNFVLDKKYGVATRSKKFFIIGHVNRWLLISIIGGAVIAASVYAIPIVGPAVWLLFAVIFSAYEFITNYLYPIWILPRINHLTPLAEGALKSLIIDYSYKVSFSIDNVFILDSSKSSDRGAAFLCGMGKNKRIVLSDTLVNDHSHQELVAIFAHEVGHYKMNHVRRLYGIMVMNTTLLCYILSLFVFNEQLSISLGCSGLALEVNLMVFLITLSPLSNFLKVFVYMTKRKYELEADQFSKQTFCGVALASALEKLYSTNLLNLYPHPLYVWFNHSHPPLLKRLALLEQVENK